MQMDESTNVCSIYVEKVYYRVRARFAHLLIITLIIHLCSVFSQLSKNASQKGNYNYKLSNYVY